MTKRKYLKRLRRALKGVPHREVENLVAYYSELIDDAFERGKTAREVFADLSTPEEAAAQYLKEEGILPIDEYDAPKRERSCSSAWLLPFRILLGIIAFALGIAGLVILVAFAVAGVALVIAGAFTLVLSVGLIIGGHFAEGFAQIGMGIVTGGIGVLLVAVSPLIWKLTCILWHAACNKPQKASPVRRGTIRGVAVGAVVLVLGGLVFTASFGALGFRYDSLAIVDGVITHEQTVEGDFSDVTFRADNFGLKVERGESEELRVVYRETEDLPRVFKAEGGEISLQTYEKEKNFLFAYWIRRSWDHGLLFDAVTRDLNEATLILPASFAGGLTVEISNGTVKIEDFSFTELSVSVSNGTVNLAQVTAETISVKTNNGAVSLEKTTAKKITAETDNGAVRFNKLAADEIIVTVDNGSVLGSIAGRKEDYRIEAKTHVGSCNIKARDTGEKSLSVKVSCGSIMIHFE